MNQMKIKPYEKNAKKHPKKQLDQLAKVVKEVGWRQPVVVNQHGVIVVGHGRWETYEKNKESLKEIWVIDDTGKTIMGAPETIPLTKDQEMMWRLADNKLNESDWDMGLVTEELKLLSPEMIDLSGFKRDIILQSTEDEYDVENGLKNEVRVNKGDIWRLGSHRLMCGDSTRKEDVGRLMDGKKADMVFTDPPYGISIVGKNGKVGAENLAKNATYIPVAGDETTDAAKGFIEVCQKMIFDKQIIWGGNYFIDFLPMSDSWLIWDKRLEMKSNNFADGEMAWCSFHTPVRIYKQLWNGMIRGGEHEKRVHPTQKPIRMLGDILKDFTEDGNSILDGFGVSGSTLIACEQVNRVCYMMELDPKYCTVILDRWEKLTGKKAEKIWQDQL